MAKTPDVYEKFLKSKGHEKYAGLAIQNLPTWGDTQTEVAFLPALDLGLLEENEVDTSEHPQVIPIARVGQDLGTSAFLAIDAAKKTCPVLLWDEGQFHPVAKSFETFLKQLKKKPAGERKSASYYEGIFRSVFDQNRNKNYKGALAILERPVQIGAPNVKERANLAEPVSNMFNCSGVAKTHVPGKDPVPDFELAIAWAKAGKVTPRYAYLNLIDWYAYEAHAFERAIARAREVLELEPGEDEVEFYARKAMGLSHLGLGDDVAAEDAYKQVHKRFGKDAAKKKEVVADLEKASSKLKSRELAKTIAKRFKSGTWK